MPRFQGQGTIKSHGTSPRRNNRGPTVTQPGGVVSALSAYDQAVLADSPAGYWKLNETTGTAIVDSSGNGRDGVLTLSAGSLNVTGPAAGMPAIDFVTATRINFGDNDAWSTANYSIEFFARMDAVHYGVMMAKSTDGATEFYFESYTDDSIYLDLINTVAGSYLRANPGYVIDTWYHFVWTVSGTTLTLYTNGVQSAQDATPTGTREGNTTTAMTAGGTLAAAPAYFNGKMSHIAYYPTAISEARALAHYEARA